MAKRPPVSLGAIPRADLLPDAQRAEIRHERTLPKLLLALVASALVAALIWAAGMIPVLFAQQELAQVESESEQLTAEIAAFSETQELLRAVGSRSSDRQVLTEQEVLFMELRDQVQAQVPEGSSLVRFAAALPGAADAGGEAPRTAGLQCDATGATVALTLASPADGLANAAQLIESSRSIEGFLCATVVDSQTLIDETTSTTETQVELVFDEAVRAMRFAEGGEQ